MNAFIVLVAALIVNAHAGEKKKLNLGLVPNSQQGRTVPVSTQTQDPSQGRDPNDPNAANVRVFPGGGAEDLLHVTKRLDDNPEDAVREGDQRQNVETQRLQNQLPNGLSNAASRGSTPLNSQGR